MSDTCAASLDLQTSLLRLALEAAPGSLTRAILCRAASFHLPADDRAASLGGIAREQAAELFSAVSAARVAEDAGHAPSHMLRYLDEALDLFDHPAEHGDL